jgi:DNA-binding CsgD family transcriptional regulator
VVVAAPARASGLGHALGRAVEEVPGESLSASLHAVVRALVLAVSAEAALLWLRATDREEAMHLLSAEGVPTRDKTRIAVEPLEVATIRSLMALGPYHSIARVLGLRWVGGTWLTGEEVVGAIAVGSRTDRRPSADELDVLRATGARLAGRLAGADRRHDALRKATRSTVAEWLEEQPGFSEGPLATLRPRERTVLVLYAEGLSATEIARLLVLSPHTVRTHVKNAFRRLGVHSREEATELVREHEVGRLV